MDVPFESLTLTGFINLPVLSEWTSCWILQTLTLIWLNTVVAQPLIPGTGTTWKPYSDISYAGTCGKHSEYGEWDSEAENSTDVRSEGNFSSPHLACMSLWMRERTPSDAWEIHSDSHCKLFYMCISVCVCLVSSHEPTAIITARCTDWREAKSDQAEMNVGWHTSFIFPRGFTTAPAWLKPLCDKLKLQFPEMMPCGIWIKLSFIVSAPSGTMKHNLPLVNPHHKRPGLIQTHAMPFWLLVIAERWEMQVNVCTLSEGTQAVMDEPAERTTDSWTKETLMAQNIL